MQNYQTQTITGNGNYVTHVVELSGNHITLDGVTISGGYAQGTMDGENYCLDCFGAGIYLLNPETTAADYSLSAEERLAKETQRRMKQREFDLNNNDKNNIGGIPTNQDTYYYDLIQVTLTDNKAIQGGAIYAYSYIDLTMTGCVVEDNEAFDGSQHPGAGGGIYISYHSTLTISNSEFKLSVSVCACLILLVI